jgi:primosomal replication protein N
MILNIITIIALAIFGLGVYCRNCVLNDRCDNLEAENERLHQLQAKYVQEAAEIERYNNWLEHQNGQLEKQHSCFGALVMPVVWRMN